MDQNEHVFDRGVRLTPGAAGLEGSFDKDWWVDRGPNGGFLAAVILHAAQHAVDDTTRHVCSLAVQYIDRPTEGRFSVAPRVERIGRSMTAVTVRLHQDERLLATAQVTFATERSGLEFSEDPMPDVTPPEDIPELKVPGDVVPPFSLNFDYRWAIGSFPFSGAAESLTGGWIRPKVPRLVDPLLVATYADAWPPAIFSRLTGPLGVPTVDLTVHFRTRLDAPTDDWCLVRFRAGTASGGFVEEDGAIWSRDGKLLAHSRQLALVLGDGSGG